VLLWHDGKPFEALFTRSCGGRTQSGIACPICTREPNTWKRTHPVADVAALLKERSEQARIAVVRRLGWDAIPSNAYEVTVDGDTATFSGAGEGHGMGLCQRGAVGLARQGASWRDILHRYFPAVLIR
jgi:stage II sporulation protein D